MDDFFDIFAAQAQRNGLEQTVLKFQKRFDQDEIDTYVREYQKRAESVRVGYPPKILAAPGMKPWYPGPLADDPYWMPYAEFLKQQKRWPRDRLKVLDEASSKVIAFTNDPSHATFLTKGLVVGYVQSGKTTNYTAVIAKAADVGYRLIIVLSGIHNGLRRQTQERLAEQLLARKDDGWFTLTSVDSDFEEQNTKAAAYLHQSGTGVTLCVVKKNHLRLERLIEWLRPAGQAGSFVDLPVLIIDDEADQASVDTATINPQIRQLINLFDKRTYLGYTATPFANVLIDPSAEDLYPETFILSLPQPDGYFGAEKIFGREAVEGEATGSDLDGHDMVRIVPDNTVNLLRPSRRADTPDFAPSMTKDLTAAVRYFWMATAARRCRGDYEHSTMLVHPSMQTIVHEAYRAPLLQMQQNMVEALEDRDEEVLEQLRRQWEEESRKVPAAQFGNRFISFDDLLEHLPDVVARTDVVLDNHRSRDRLNYTGDPVVAIAVGGNTLSRGLTLEGLVVSFFVRSARTYDTLLQMGRWFGFRPGYEDLPRIWMTKQLKEYFRHLATVEHEIRLDIRRYEEENIPPSEVGVRIRTHPVLNVTAKMGRARTAYASYGGRRVQTRYFRESDLGWLVDNLEAARTLIGDALRDGASLQDHGTGEVLLRNVDVRHVLRFVNNYQVHEDSPDLEPRLIHAYIEKENRRSPQSLLSWTVAVMGGPVPGARHLVKFDEQVQVGTINRSKLKDSGGEKADIKTLMTKEHRVIDMDVPAAEARRKSEEGLVALRNDHPDFQDQGLLLLYPIAKDSPPDEANQDTRRPLEAVEHIIGTAFVFPGNSKDKVANRYVQVGIDHQAIDPAEYADAASALNDEADDA